MLLWMCQPGVGLEFVSDCADEIDRVHAGANEGCPYHDVVPPERVVSTERSGPEWPETFNAVALTESGGHTTITLTVAYPSKEARDSAIQLGVTKGMVPGFTRLEELQRRFA